MPALALPIDAPEPPTLAAWRTGLATIDPTIFRPPGMLTLPRPYETRSGRTGFDPAPWPDVYAAMLAFLDVWGAQAVDLGWTTEQLFGVHRSACAIRVDATGALVTLYPMTVEAMDATTIALVRDGSRQTFRGLTNPDESVPIWAFGKGSRSAAAAAQPSPKQRRRAPKALPPPTMSERAEAAVAARALLAAIEDRAPWGDEQTMHVDCSRPRRAEWITTWANLPGLTRINGEYHHALLPGWQYSRAEVRSEMIPDLEALAERGVRPVEATRTAGAPG